MKRRPFTRRAMRMSGWLLSLSLFGMAQPADTLTSLQKREAVGRIAGIYESRYVDPELGKRMADLIRSKLSAGAYDAPADGRAFARQITQDLRSVISDLHLTVAFLPEEVKKRRSAPAGLRAEEERKEARRRNHGFPEVKVLDGNVGYLRVSSFEGSPEAYATAGHALQFLRHCDALIMDLRFNPGGDSGMVQFLASRFLSGPPVLLDEFHYRQADRISQLWSLPVDSGESLAGMALYILIDRYTFSAAEGLAYDLQALKRAVILGSVSAGGAHIAEEETLAEGFLLFIPVAYSKNPITHGNFQGKGILPDVPLNPEKALTEAHLLVLEKRMQKETDPGHKKELADLIRRLKGEPEIKEEL